MLDDAMHELSATDREAILMRYFERLPVAEIGSRLGLKENAAHMRIERAIDRLRTALAKRGVTSTITALTASLTGRAVGSAPTGLATQVSRTAFASAAAESGLGWGLLKLAGLMKGKLAVAVGGALLVASLVVVPQLLTKSTGMAATSGVSIRTREQNAVLGEEVAGAVRLASVGKAASSNELLLQVLANDGGEPIAGARLEFRSGLLAPAKITADKLGVCEIPISHDTKDSLVVSSRTDGYVDTSVTWIPRRGERIPRQYTLRLASSVPIGGRVVDEDGKPVAGAEVFASCDGQSASEDNPFPPHISTGGEEKTVTDNEGRWRVDRFARADISTVGFLATHPGYATNVTVNYFNAPKIEQQRLDGTYVYMLDRGVTVTGIVIDSEGNPLSGAKVTAQSGARSSETTNQPDGTFMLDGCKPGPGQINVEAHGFALATINLDITNNQGPWRVALRPANVLRTRVVDTNGLPVPNAFVTLNFNPAAVGASGNLILPGLFRKQAGADGRFLWDSAPQGNLRFDIEAYGYERAMNIAVEADGKEHLVALRAPRTISGSVRDAVTGQLISPFRMVIGRILSPWPFSPEGTNVHWDGVQTFRDGTFRYKCENSDASSEYKFEADGYGSFITEIVGPEERDVSFDILLFPAITTTITVVLPDGQPATNAFVGLEMPGSRLVLTPGGFRPPGRRAYKNVLPTDSAGQVVLPSDDTISRVIAVSPDGYAETTPAALGTGPTMRLRPWGRIEGNLLSGGKPAGGRVLTLGWAGINMFMFDGFLISKQEFIAETDAEGHFAFPQAPPGQISFFQTDTRQGIRPLPVPAVTVQPGETATASVDLYTVTARLSLPTGVQMGTNWQVTVLVSQLGGVQSVWESLKKSDDGTWAAEDLAAGDYKLRADIMDSAIDGPARKLNLEATASFTLPSGPSSGTLDLGEIVLQQAQ